jgi:hypothetical protein
MKVIDDLPKYVIFSVELPKVDKLTKDFLNFVCLNKYGVQKNNYWIFNSSLNIYENGDFSIPFFNQLLYNCLIRGYSQIMITEPQIKEEIIQTENPTN